jgi:hypothetical protein
LHRWIALVKALLLSRKKFTWTFETLNGHSSVIKQPTAMNFALLDSSRQRASFDTKIRKKMKF